MVPAPWLSAFNSISSVGQFFGGFLCSIFADRYGRRMALGVGVLITCGGIFGELFSTARAAFLTSKLILGVGLGFYLTIGPLYSSEVSLVNHLRWEADVVTHTMNRSRLLSSVVLPLRVSIWVL